MTFPKIGLALGGGAARGLAHIGVLQALIENKIPISCVAGCSMGAVIAGIYAAGSDMVMLEKLAYSLDEKDIFDIGVPRMGLLKGKKAENLIATLTKNRTFDQTEIPLAIIATDMITGRNIIITEGKISDAVRASISIPGVFDPVERGDMLLVDGGVTERVPVRAIKVLAPEMIIAVDVGYRGYTRKRPQNIFEMLQLSFEITDWEVTKEMLASADVLIAPDVYDVNPMSLTDARKCVQKGKEAGLAAIKGILSAAAEFEHTDVRPSVG